MDYNRAACDFIAKYCDGETEYLKRKILTFADTLSAQAEIGGCLTPIPQYIQLNVIVPGGNPVPTVIPTSDIICICRKSRDGKCKVQLGLGGMADTDTSFEWLADVLGAVAERDT